MDAWPGGERRGGLSPGHDETVETEEELMRLPGVCEECKAGSTVEPVERTGGLQWQQQAASGVLEGPLV